ncbi:uncharacterized protein N7518_002605 [Penicillium psychrosexuale]|uniref:uncharacterized protein n=1 Tax=Penicillium psychrosexuale TaxID=1002107 RepID=UPI002545852C|nr:uncharacterized protein N7518_002605 [Penicillium psychrosexuale]KAJ5800537.1 hypothetical protein N7518_002605 [Penicillium psychrosexuale]
MSLPEDSQQWQDTVLAVCGNSLPPTPDQITWTGGSHITETQFLALRCYWPNHMIPQSSIDSYEARRLETYRQFSSARQWLGAYPPFGGYLNHIRNNQRTKPWNIGDSDTDAYGLGIMEIPRRTQEIIRAAVRDNQPFDEQMIIASLVSFLQSIAVRNPQVRYDWSSHRRHIQAQFAQSQLNLFVDGALVNPATNEIKALLEAKRDSGNKKQVSWQISAEIAAFISRLRGTRQKVRSLS